jgi:hypothetical protein
MVTIDSYALANHDDGSILNAVHPSANVNKSAAGQCFTGLANYNLVSAQFCLGKVGNPVGNLVAVLYALQGVFGVSGKPTGPALATSNSVAMAGLGADAMVTFTFPTPYYTLAATTYCIVCQVKDAVTLGGPDYLVIGYDSSAPTHAGNYFTYASSAWTAYAGLDACFLVDGSLAQIQGSCSKLVGMGGI